MLLAALGVWWATLCLWLATRFGTGAAVGTTIVVLVFSLLYGGTWLSRTWLWLLGPFGWPQSADTPGRLTLVLAVCLVGTGLAWWGWARALRRAARR